MISQRSSTLTHGISAVTLALVLLLSFILAQPLISTSLTEIKHISLVNMFIGTTASRGKCFPAATAPFGMVEWGPLTKRPSEHRRSPGLHYDYYDTRIYGIIATHFPSGSCMLDYGWFSIMPITGNPVPEPSAIYRHSQERASPGYYFIKLDGVRIEVSATERGGFFRFYYERNDKKGVVIYVPEGSVNVIPEKRTVLLKSTHRFPAYYVLIFDTNFSDYGIFSKGRIIAGIDNANGVDIWFFIMFPKGSMKVLLKIGSSFISFDQAKLNLEREIPDWNFEEIKSKVSSMWEELLSRVDVYGDKEEKIIFYTALYHSLLLPRIFYEIGSDGKPYHRSPFDGNVHKGIYFEDYSLWDTFRALHPLLVLLYPKIARDMVIGLLNMYKESGWMPKWPNPDFSNVMIGTHADSVLADAYVKGIRDFNLSLAYIAAYKDAMVPARREVVILEVPGFISFRLRASSGKGLGTILFEPPRGKGSIEFAWLYDDNKWHHMAVVYRDGTVEVYIDGTCVARGSAQITDGSIRGYIYLGASADMSKGYSGELDEFRVYDRALSVGEVRNLASGKVVQGSLFALSFEGLKEINKKGGRVYGRVIWVSGVNGSCVKLEGLDAIKVPFTLHKVKQFTISLWFKTLQSPTSYEGRQATEYYMRYGYIPLDLGIGEEVSITLESAYDDYCVAQLAYAMYNATGDEHFLKEYKYLINRSKNYRFVYYPFPGSYQGLVRGRYLNGTWVKPYSPESFESYITEGTPWIYSWFVPHDVRGLINIMGGSARFIKMLEEFMSLGETMSPDFSWSPYYTHGNEPSHHVAYLFVYAGAPWRTQYWVREIMYKCYKNNPNGLPGDDDAGQMSAWFVFSAMGFYPVCPGAPYYVIGSPLFDKVVIHLDSYWGGKDFVIIAHNNSPDNRYIASATLNGRSYNLAWISHWDIVKGGVLELYMSDKPSKWGVARSPPSLTSSHPHIVIKELRTLPTTAYAGDPITVRVTVRNEGGLGIACINLHINDTIVSTLCRILDSGEETVFKEKIRVYKSGRYVVSAGNKSSRILVKLYPYAKLICKELKAYWSEKYTRIEFILVNVGSERAKGDEVVVTIDEKPVGTFKIYLDPEQSKKYKLRVPLLYGIHRVNVAGVSTLYVGPFIDRAGKAKEISIVGRVYPIKGPFGYGVMLDGSSYIEIASYPELNLVDEFTISVWVKPKGLGRWQRIVSKWGANPSTKAYQLWIAGYSIAVEVTPRWVDTGIELHTNTWYHIVWVHSKSRGREEVYINGSLVWVHSYLGDARKTRHPLAIGNSITESMFFKGSVDEVRIYSRALSSSEIKVIFEKNYPIKKGLVLWISFDGLGGVEEKIVVKKTFNWTSLRYPLILTIIILVLLVILFKTRRRLRDWCRHDEG